MISVLGLRVAGRRLGCARLPRRASKWKHTVYAGAVARTAARLKIEYELLFTQRLVLQPEFEMNLYGKADLRRDIAAGLSDLEVGVRLRCEVRREVAPYAGVIWAKHRGAGGDILRAAGADSDGIRIAIGLRLWL